MNKYVEHLASLEGYKDPWAWVEALMAEEDFLSNGICTECMTDTKVEPDCANATCDGCGAKAVSHVFVLLGVI